MNNKLMERTDDGKILITFICLSPNTITITYEHNLEFLTLMDFYVSKLAGARELKTWSVNNPEKTLLDK